EGPFALALLAFERGRIAETLERRDLAPNNTVKIGTDWTRRALVEAVANLAESDVAFTLLGISLGERGKDLGTWGCLSPRLGAFRRLRGFGGRQRRRALGLAAEEHDHIGALLRVGDAGKGHRRAGGKGLRVGEPVVEVLVSPNLSGMSLKRRRVVEALDRR